MQFEYNRVKYFVNKFKMTLKPAKIMFVREQKHYGSKLLNVRSNIKERL